MILHVLPKDIHKFIYMLRKDIQGSIWVCIDAEEL